MCDGYAYYKERVLMSYYSNSGGVIPMPSMSSEEALYSLVTQYTLFTIVCYDLKSIIRKE